MDWEAYEEAERRGLLTPEQSEALGEARRRGLTKARRPSQAEAFGRGALNWSGWADNATEAVLGQVAKLDPEYAREVASRTLGPQARSMSPEQLARARVDQAIREPQARSAEARPVSMAAGQIAGALPAAIATGGVGTARAGTPILQRMAYNAAQAMPAGAAWGGIQASGNADAPDQNRLIEGAKGAAIGAGLAGVLGATAPEIVNAGASVAQTSSGLINRFNLTPEQRALRMIQKRVDPRALAATDGPEQIVDVGGKRLVGLGDAVAQFDETPGAEIMSAARTGQRADVQDFMLARGAGATGKDQAGYSANIEALKARRKADAAPLYARAYQTPVPEMRASAGEVDSLLEQARFAREPDPPLQSLLSFLRSRGGLRDDTGDLESVLGSRTGRTNKVVGLFNSRGGVSLDDAARAAWERGYIGGGYNGGQQRPLTDDLLEAIRREMAGEKIYAADDAAAAADMEARAQARRFFEERGVNYRADDETLRGQLGGSVGVRIEDTMDADGAAVAAKLTPILQRVPAKVMAEADRLAALDGVPQPSQFQKLDYVSQAIASVLETEAPRDVAGRVVATPVGRRLIQIKSELDNVLYELSDLYSGGAFRQARQAYAGPSAQMEAQRLGRTVVQARNFDPEDLAERLTRLSADEQDAFILGVARGIADQTETGQVARFASNLRGNRRLRQRLTVALGKERFDTLVAVTERAGKMLENTNRMLRGSQTANRTANIKDATEGEAELAQMALDVASGNVRGPIARRLGQMWMRRSMPGIADPRVSEAVARRLTQQATPENIRALVDEMAGLDQLRGSALQPVAIPQSARAYGVVGNAQPPRPRGMLEGRRR